MPVRERLKRLVEPRLAASGLPALTRRRLAGRTLVLAYHNIVPTGCTPAGDASLHLAQERFAEQLDALCRSHEVIRLERALEAGDPGARPRAVITFDDAYRGAVTAGVEELALRGLPATIFVAPRLLGGSAFWWDVVGSARAPADTIAAWREHGVHELGGRQADVLRWLESAGVVAEAVPSHALPATEDELHAACARHPGLRLGAHSWSHPNLARVDGHELEREMREPLAWLRERFPATIPWLAYPYGITSEASIRLAQESGYAGAVLVEGGWIRPGATDRFQVPRLTIPAQLTGDGFVLRSSGVVRR